MKRHSHLHNLGRLRSKCAPMPCHPWWTKKNLDWETCAGHATRVGWSGTDYFLGVKAIPFNIYPHPLAPLRKAVENYIFGGGRCVGTVDLWSIPESRGMGKEPRPHHSGGGTGSVALREGDRKCWITLSFRRKSTQTKICRRRPFDRLKIIIGQGSLVRTDNHERKNMHVILKLLYTSDPSALVCVLWIVTTIWLASFWSIYRVDSTVNKGENWKITDHSSKSGWQTNAAFLYWYLRDGLFHGFSTFDMDKLEKTCRLPLQRGTNSTTRSYITGTANFNINEDNFRTHSSQALFERFVINLLWQ